MPPPHAGSTPTMRRVKTRRKRHTPRKRDLVQRLGLALMLLLLLGYGVLLLRSFRSARQTTPGAQEPATRKPYPGKTPASQVPGSIAEQLNTLKEQAKTADQQLARTYKLIKNGAWERALEQVGFVLAAMPENVAARRLQAGIHIGLRQYDLAVTELMDVLATAPDNWDARLGLVGALLAMKEYEAALLLADWMIEEQPYSMEARRAAASAGMSLGQYAPTILHLKKMLEIDGENREARQMLSLAYRRQGSYDRAIKLLMEQMAMDEQDSVVYYNLAVCYAAKNDPQTSLDWLRKASSRFGHSFVRSWINAEEFDPIRTNADFTAFFASRNDIKFVE